MTWLMSRKKTPEGRKTARPCPGATSTKGGDDDRQPQDPQLRPLPRNTTLSNTRAQADEHVENRTASNVGRRAKNFQREDDLFYEIGIAHNRASGETPSTSAKN